MSQLMSQLISVDVTIHLTVDVTIHLTVGVTLDTGCWVRSH